MSEEELYGSQVPRLLVNLRRLGAAHRVRPVCRSIETGALNPSMDDAGVPACREVRVLPEAAREQILSPYATETGRPISDSASGLLGDFETNRSAHLLLDYRCSIANPPARAYVVDFKTNEVAAPQLAVDGEIEHREITFAVLQLEPHPDRPHVLRLQRALLTDQASLVPRLAALRQGYWVCHEDGRVRSDPSTPAPLDLDRLGKLSPLGRCCAGHRPYAERRRNRKVHPKGDLR
jgi:hypothetical protein